jgi:diguanylate cyclase (GGDEF)-like protein
VSAASTRRGESAGPPWYAVSQWPLWSLPRRALAFLIFIEGTAATLTLVALLNAHPASSDITRLALLAVLSAIYSEAEDITDRFRRYRAQGRPYVDAQSVWTFAGVLLLPAGYAALLVAIIYSHTVLRARRHHSWRPYRIAFTGAAVMLAVLASSVINNSLRDVAHLPHGAAQAVAVIGAMVAYRVVNDVAIAIVIYLATSPQSIKEVLLHRDELAVEIATMILGVFTAQTVILMPWLTPAVLVLIVMMYRGLLARKLEVDAATDGKTGLLNATAWRELAQRHLWRAIREDQAAAMLVIDLDRFKALNDEHGHLAGDIALATVADCIKHELRDYDAVGRYGGEEFAAMLPNAGANAGMRAAERVRARIEQCSITAVPDGPELHLTASIGVATYPSYGTELDELIRAADLALYAAKAAGRNAVRLADPRVTPASQQPRPSHA